MSTKTDFDVPVKAILNNLIELDNGEKVAGVKIIPRNIFILEENDQFSILSRLSFISCLKKRILRLFKRELDL